MHFKNTILTSHEIGYKVYKVLFPLPIYFIALENIIALFIEQVIK